MRYELHINFFTGKMEWMLIETSGTTPAYVIETGSPMGLLLALTYQT